MLGALFNGLTAMSVRHAGRAQRVPAIAPVMRRMLQVLLAP
jgi:TetR/AcrR family transcriptional repressor of uid operon